MARHAGGTQQPQTSLGKGLRQGGCRSQGLDHSASGHRVNVARIVSLALRIGSAGSHLQIRFTDSKKLNAKTELEFE